MSSYGWDDDGDAAGDDHDHEHYCEHYGEHDDKRMWSNLATQSHLFPLTFWIKFNYFSNFNAFRNYILHWFIITFSSASNSIYNSGIN